MGKIIKFDSCEQCPYAMDKNKEYYCLAEHKYFYLRNEIPDWCPLDESTISGEG